MEHPFRRFSVSADAHTFATKSSFAPVLFATFRWHGLPASSVSWRTVTNRITIYFESKLMNGTSRHHDVPLPELERQIRFIQKRHYVFIHSFSQFTNHGRPVSREHSRGCARHPQVRARPMRSFCHGVVSISQTARMYCAK